MLILSGFTREINESGGKYGNKNLCRKLAF